MSRWWFQLFFYFHPYLGKIPLLTSIFFKGGNCAGSYTNLVEQFEGTPDGYLHLVDCPPGGETYDVLLVSDSSFALVRGHDTGNPTRFIASDICHPTTRVREYFGKLCWGKGLSQIIDAISTGLDEIEEKCRAESRPIKPVLVMVVETTN